jgi:DNA-binding PucR family transcriptional regulator
MGRAGVRVSAVVGCLLLVVASIGWWLDTRVIDDAGFADVVTQASQRQGVRDYIADQATLRLARTSNFVTAARPAVTDAVSAAIHTPPVADAIRDFATRAHEQVFEARAARRVDIDAQQTATSVRSALQSINPALAKKLPANVLDASATISQNQAVDVLFRLSGWIWLWIPIGALGIFLLIRAVRRADDQVAALRTIGVVMAVSGAILAGVGVAAPVVGAIVAQGDELRSEAIAEFVQLLTGRLTGAGLALILFGLAGARAPRRV